MRKRFILIFMAVLVWLFLQSMQQALAQPAYPSDLEIEAWSGGVAPWTPLYRVQIDFSGYTVYARIEPGNRSTATWTTISSFTLTADQMDTIWNAIVANDFFSLEENYTAFVCDGTFAVMNITANGATHKVITKNIKVPAFDAIVVTINDATPGDYDLFYNEINSGSGSGSGSSVSTQGYTDTSSTTSTTSLAFFSICVPSFVAVSLGIWFHPHRQMLSRRRRWRFSNFSRIVISSLLILITFTMIAQPVLGDYTKVTIAGCKITVKVCVEFYGPGATEARRGELETAMEQSWNVGNWRIKCVCTWPIKEPGCSVTFDVVSKVRKETDPETPNHHQVFLMKDPDKKHRSYVDLIKDGPIQGWRLPNLGERGSGNWSDTDNGWVAEHEMGHIMGIYDKYHDEPGADGKLGTDDDESKADAGYEDDMMAARGGKVKQWHIDDIISRAGIVCPKECCPAEGGTTTPVDKIGLLRPWIALAILTTVATVSLAFYRKKHETKKVRTDT